MINRYQIIILIRRYEIIIASLMVLLSLTAASYLFLIPNFNRAKIIFGQKSQLQKRLDKLKQKENALSDLDIKYYQGVLTKFYRILPDGKDYISLFETLDSLEKKANVKVTGSTFPLGSLSGGTAQLKKSVAGSVYIFPVSMAIQGDFPSILTCLDTLDDLSGRIITVDSVSIQKDKANVYKFSLTGNTFVALPPSTIGSVESPIPKINNNQQALMDKIAKIKMDTPELTGQEKVPIGKKNLFD